MTLRQPYWQPSKRICQVNLSDTKLGGCQHAFKGADSMATIPNSYVK